MATFRPHGAYGTGRRHKIGIRMPESWTLNEIHSGGPCTGPLGSMAPVRHSKTVDVKKSQRWPDASFGESSIPPTKL